MKSDTSEITQLVSDGAGIWTLNLSYLKNKSTTKEKCLKLIFKTPYNQCEPPTSAPSPAAFWVSPTPGRLIHGIPWHGLSCHFFTPVPRPFAPLPCPAEPHSQNWALWAERSQFTRVSQYGPHFSWSSTAATEESVFPKPSSPVLNTVAGE